MRVAHRLLNAVCRCKTIVSLPRVVYFPRRLQSSSIVSAALRELHPLQENTHAHGLLEGNSNYAQSLTSFSKLLSELPDVSTQEVEGILAQTDWKTVPLDEACTLFRALSAETHKVSRKPYNDLRYTAVHKGLVERLNDMSDEQLGHILQSLSVWPLCESTVSKPFYDFWSRIDAICIERKANWPREKVLYFVDLWHAMRLVRISNFVYQSILQMANKPSSLTGPQVVQVLYYLNAMRTAHKGVAMYYMEARLEKFINDFTLNELAVAALGFFKTRNPIRSEALLKHMMDKLTDEVATAPDIVIASILKVVRQSIPLPMWNLLPDFLDRLEPEIDRMSLQAAVHLALVTTKSHSLHPSSLTKVGQKLLDDITNARLKDIEKLLYPMTLLNFSPPTTVDFYQVVLKELDNPLREKEYLLYSKTLIAILHYFALRGLFHTKLINRVLDMGFVRNVYGKTNYAIGREILTIDTCVELDCPTYRGNRLPREVRNYLSKRYSTFLPDESRRLSKHAQFVLDIFKHVSLLVGKDKVAFKYLVPDQSRADLVIRLDDTNRPTAIPPEYLTIEDFTGPVRAPCDGHRWKAIVIITKNLCNFNSRDINGETSCKVKHLKDLGYDPLMIYGLDWGGDSEQKLKLLKDSLFSSN